ncbi:hypothetical protein FNJ88_14205 (plasmid) [Chryseobacterium sp. SNU WT5]|uniref:hypothetical protein n=1 Tax=Chryseobacterium sp. SNU WT5 TaxID=2594269 RepID=UPI00117D45E1|nr:hypothetical protein [Chryseobacterium sp. SNU WT5]QDP86754.1 hypothetical protein FNJ88_14205 [Chryseobacterium sp. SNU WT5]
MRTTIKLPLGIVIFGIVGLLFTILNSFRLERKIENFDEINVQRINVIEKDGTIRMVISNKELQHSGRMNGKDWEKRERQAGMIFFNDLGDECGGLIYENKKRSDGSIKNGMSITMDQYKDDQVIQILNNESIKGGKMTSERGFSVNSFKSLTGIDARNKAYQDAEKINDEKLRKEKIIDISKNHGSSKLLFLGKTTGNSQGLFIADQNGQPKLMVYVNEKGDPKIQTFNEKGEVKDFLINPAK